jgi:hypothetical protein
MWQEWWTRGACWVLVVKPEAKTSFGRPGRRWEDNIKMDLKGDGEAWTGLIYIRIGTGGGGALVRKVHEIG